MTRDEILQTIEPLKNKHGQYEFWLTLQTGFFPTSGRHNNPLEALRMAFSNSANGNYLDDEHLIQMLSDQNFDAPHSAQSLTPESAEELAKETIAELFVANKIHKRMSLTWRGLGIPQSFSFTMPEINFTGRSATGALKNLAIGHRRVSPNLEVHRHGVPSFVSNLRLMMEGFFGLEKGLSDNRFFSQLILAEMVTVNEIDGMTESFGIIE